MRALQVVIRDVENAVILRRVQKHGIRVDAAQKVGKGSREKGEVEPVVMGHVRHWRYHVGLWNIGTLRAGLLFLDERKYALSVTPRQRRARQYTY